MSGRYDFDDDGFYEQAGRLARAGMTDKEIASAMRLSPSYFSKIKNGNVDGWADADREARSARLRKTLRDARLQVTSALHATYLNMALGKVYTRQRVRKMQEAACACGGGDPNCPDCGGTGRVVTELGVVQESEVQQPPSLQAISVLLNVFDPDWRGGVAEDEAGAARGIDICRWIERETAAGAAGGEGGDDKDA